MKKENVNISDAFTRGNKKFLIQLTQEYKPKSNMGTYRYVIYEVEDDPLHCSILDVGWDFYATGKMGHKKTTELFKDFYREYKK